MGYDNSYNERQEAYEAGRAGQSIHTAHADEYQRGVKSRKAAQAARESPGMLGILALAVFVFLIAMIALVVVSALLAVLGAMAAMLAARLWSPGARVSYSDAYKACLIATFGWLAIVGSIGIAAVAWRDDAPRAVLGIVQSIALDFHVACLWLIGHFVPMLPPETHQALRLPPTGMAAGAAGATRAVAVAILLAPASLLSAFLLGAAGHPYRGWLGYARACLTLPLVLLAELPLALFLAALVIRYTWNL
jgi:hypothetical protein